eukprot:15458075-Alexandrium_andersonii.AAC.1
MPEAPERVHSSQWAVETPVKSPFQPPQSLPWSTLRAPLRACAGCPGQLPRSTQEAVVGSETSHRSPLGLRFGAAHVSQWAAE